MKSRVEQIYEAVCTPVPKPYFFVVDQEKGETVEQIENVSHRTFEHDICVYFVT